jgi:hypothetical protein
MMGMAMPKDDKVRHLLMGIQMPSLQTAVLFVHSSPAFRNNFDAAVDSIMMPRKGPFLKSHQQLLKMVSTQNRLLVKAIKATKEAEVGKEAVVTKRTWFYQGCSHGHGRGSGRGQGEP